MTKEALIQIFSEAKALVEAAAKEESLRLLEQTNNDINAYMDGALAAIPNDEHDGIKTVIAAIKNVHAITIPRTFLYGAQYAAATLVKKINETEKEMNRPTPTTEIN